MRKTIRVHLWERNRKKGVSYWLRWTTKDGKPQYEQVGFTTKMQAETRRAVKEHEVNQESEPDSVEELMKWVCQEIPRELLSAKLIRKEDQGRVHEIVQHVIFEGVKPDDE